jgi:hypothetical protein
VKVVSLDGSRDGAALYQTGGLHMGTGANKYIGFGQENGKISSNCFFVIHVRTILTKVSSREVLREKKDGQ